MSEPAESGDLAGDLGGLDSADDASAQRTGIVGPQDVVPEGETPLLDESLSPEVPDEGGDGRHDPAQRRLAAEIDAGKYPTEPQMRPSGVKKADQSLRDLTMFAVISRLLIRNQSNAQILAALEEAGFPMSTRSLQRTMARGDFVEYYEQFRGKMMAPIDKLYRDNMKLAVPEASNHLIRLMRNARSESVRLAATIEILKGGGAIREERIEKKLIYNVPPELQKQLFEAGARIAGVTDAIVVPPTPASPEPKPS